MSRAQEKGARGCGPQAPQSALFSNHREHNIGGLIFKSISEAEAHELMGDWVPIYPIVDGMLRPAWYNGMTGKTRKPVQMIEALPLVLVRVPGRRKPIYILDWSADLDGFNAYIKTWSIEERQQHLAQLDLAKYEAMKKLRAKA